MERCSSHNNDYGLAFVKDKAVEVGNLACVYCDYYRGLLDQLMLMMQWIVYQNHGWSDALVPVWILALWCAFASTLNVSLVWLQGRYLMAILLGAIAGPIAYLGAERIGAVTLTGEVSYIALSYWMGIVNAFALYTSQNISINLKWFAFYEFRYISVWFVCDA